MKLLILSHTPHYNHKEQIFGWGPTVKENDELAIFFEEVEIVGFLHNNDVPASSEPYRKKNIKFSLLDPIGGESVLAKIKLVLKSFDYFLKIRKKINELDTTDWIYVRAPCNIALLSLIILSINKKPKRWIKYAGNWDKYPNEPISYRLQKSILNKNFCKGKVTINGTWQNQKAHIISVVNPCIYRPEAINARNNCLSKQITFPVKFLFVGRIEEAKGILFIEKLAEELFKQQIQYSIDVIGDGPLLSHIQNFPEKLKIKSTGYMRHSKIHTFYKNSHFFLFPSIASEGWPKVISEAMAHKCIPITSKVSSIPQVLNHYKCGISLDLNVKIWIDSINELFNNPKKWNELGLNGMDAIDDFTYEKFSENIEKDILAHYE